MALGATVLFAATVAGAVVGTPLGLKTWRNRLAGVAQSSAPLVRAIRACQRDVGVPPSDLADLVPRYLDAVPGTGLSGMVGGANWLYKRAPFLADTEKHRYGGNGWVLEVQTGMRGRGYLEMIYLPDQKYAAKVTRVGEWAMVPW
jgi:FAD/FMN-containing dehydrogenase